MNPAPVRYAISDRNASVDGGWTRLLRQAAQLANDGVEFFQVREKDLQAGELASLTHSVLAVTRSSSISVIVNGRSDVAIAASAHGVHLTSSPEELTPDQVRRLYKEAGLHSPIVTVSCHTVAGVRRRHAEGVDAILFGPVFEKVVAGERVQEGIGLTLLREACVAAGTVPILALGGVTPANAGLCLEAGARGVAGIRLFQERDAHQAGCAVAASSSASLTCSSKN